MTGQSVSRKIAASMLASLFAFWPWMAAAADSPTPPRGLVHELLAKDLLGVSGKEVRMLTVEYLAGGATLPHRHNAQVFVYVLEGSVRMQVQGMPEVTLGAGETFYEGPDDIHTVAANASTTHTAKIVVFIVKDKAAPVSTPVAPSVQK